jgi:hypothetical protein
MSLNRKTNPGKKTTDKINTIENRMKAMMLIKGIWDNKKLESTRQVGLFNIHEIDTKKHVIKKEELDEIVKIIEYMQSLQSKVIPPKEKEYASDIANQLSNIDIIRLYMQWKQEWNDEEDITGFFVNKKKLWEQDAILTFDEWMIKFMKKENNKNDAQKNSILYRLSTYMEIANLVQKYHGDNTNEIKMYMFHHAEESEQENDTNYEEDVRDEVDDTYPIEEYDEYFDRTHINRAHFWDKSEINKNTNHEDEDEEDNASWK